MPFSLTSLIVPMVSDYRPVAVAAGVLAMYGIVAIMVTSWLRKRVSR